LEIYEQKEEHFGVGKKKPIKAVTEALARYFEIYDMDNGTIHSQVFSMLYLSDKYYRYSDICKTLHIGKTTLVRYVAKYNELAKKIVKRLNY